MKKMLQLVITSTFLVTAVTAQAKRNVDPEYPWETWSRRLMVFAITELKDIRDTLFEENLHDAYVEIPYDVECGKETIGARTIDGTCNDLEKPYMGAAGIAFGRNITYDILPKAVSDDEILSPNPREISLELMTRDEFKPVPFLNLLAVSWIQFMVHDWFNHLNDETYPILMPLGEDDPSGQKEMVIFRSQRSKPGNKKKNHAYDNENTHWWDGSQLYGSTVEQHNKLRSFKDGKLKVGGDFYLPVGENGVEETGFNRNWWVGLASLHYLFVKEHNAIAEMLKEEYSDWDDQQLFDKARLINAALMAKIHTVEWTPAILDNRTLRFAMNSNWFGVFNLSSHGWANWLTPDYTQVEGGPLINLIQKSHVVGGIVGGEKELYDVDFTMTEEFVSVYRMHPLLPDNLEIVNTKGQKQAVVPLQETREEKAKHLIKDYGLETVFYSQGLAHPGQLVLNNFPSFLQDIELPLMGQVDLAAIDIIRDRERGVPRYNEFRRQVNMKPIKSFEDLFKNPEDPKSVEKIAKLKKVYNNDIEQMDLLIGCLAEEIRPKGYGFGETAFQIFIAMASRRLMADRFYTTDYNKETYTKEGIRWIDRNSMKDVLKRHYPKLKKALRGARTAFNPWQEL